MFAFKSSNLLAWYCSFIFSENIKRSVKLKNIHRAKMDGPEDNTPNENISGTSFFNFWLNSKTGSTTLTSTVIFHQLTQFTNVPGSFRIASASSLRHGVHPSGVITVLRADVMGRCNGLAQMYSYNGPNSNIKLVAKKWYSLLSILRINSFPHNKNINKNKYILKSW